MNKYIETSILLPTKNHEKIIKRNISFLRSFMGEHFQNYEILIISNNSSFENAKILEESFFQDPNIRIKFLDEKGKGSAVRWGLNNSKYKNVILYDSDFSYSFDLFHHFFEKDLPISPFIYAKRKLNREIILKTPVLRLVAGYIFNLIVRGYLQISAKDTQAGLKFINLEEFKNASKFENNEYLYDVELFLLAKKSNIEPLSIDVLEISNSNNSNINLISDSIKMLKNLREIKYQYLKSL
ncbi:hypothetical protein CM15mP35_00650 [bacterium]|jgi:hypothetical protein|nr:MAG: hypothetical protein CM15mP35_00650 [bacterium]|tara:strand:- start:1791 stop:2510 length:720 start_codon:yes stop_codon:yes gene_type:complete